MFRVEHKSHAEEDDACCTSLGSVAIDQDQGRNLVVYAQTVGGY